MRLQWIFIFGQHVRNTWLRVWGIYDEIYSLNFSEYFNNLSYTYFVILYAKILSTHYFTSLDTFQSKLFLKAKEDRDGFDSMATY